MKKLFTPLLMLAALLASTQVWAQELSVAGVNVNTSATSVQTITGSGISGTVTYNPSSKTLYLKNATINSGTSWGVFNEIADLKIELNGSNTITSSMDYATFYSRENIRIVSTSDQTGSLYVKNTASSLSMGTMFFEENKKLYVTAANLDVTADNGTALYGYKNNGEIIANYCWLHFKGSTYAVRGIKAYWPSASGIDNTVLYTNGVSFNSSKYGFVDSSSNLVKEVNCFPALILNGIAINASSSYTFTNSTTQGQAIGVTSGTVTYNYSTKTLEFKNATMSCNRNSAIISYLPGLTIKSSTGTNTITTNGNYIALDLYRSTSITGDQKLGISGTTGIYLNYRWDCPLTINLDATFDVTATKYNAVYNSKSSSSPNSDLILKKAGNKSDYYFTANSTDGEPIKDVCHLTMQDMDFYTSGCYWDAANCVVKKTGGATTKGSTVNIYRVGQWYDLWVAGHRLSDVTQYGRFGSPYLTAGTVNYDPGSKTLTLTDATISGQPSDGAAETRSAIYSTISGLTINATGTNNWTSDWITVNLGGGGTNTIKGTGDLKITSNQYHAMNAWNNTGITLARSSGSMSLKGKDRGIYGNNTTTLTINKDGSGALYKFAGEQGNITNLSSLTFGSGVNIQDGYQWFNADEKAVYYRSGLAKCATIDGTTSTWIRSNVEWTYYPIYIAGTQLYGSGSYGNISGCWNKYVQGGYNSYDPDTKTLKLDGATISSDQKVITSEANQLTVNVKGTNKLTTTAFCGIKLDKANSTMTFTGDGSLEVTGKTIGLEPWADLSEVVITDNVKLTANGSRYGIGAENSGTSNGKLSVGGNAVVKASSIGQLYAITLNDNQAIVEPFGAVIKSQSYGYYICVGNSTAQNVVIQKVEKYDLAVCDVDVNSYNKDDILRDGGTFKYDPSIKRLTITDADIDDPDVSEGVYNYGIEGLNVAIEGENHFRVVDDVFKMKNSTSFSGNGSVKGELIADDGWGINMIEGSSAYACTLNGPSFEFTGELAVSGPTNNLVIDKGCLIFNPNSSSDATMVNIYDLKFGKGMYIAKPDGGVFRGRRIRLNNNVYKGRTIICQKGDVNVDGTVAIADAVAVLNAMAGQEVAGNPDVNGDKEVSIADFVAVLNIMAGQ